MSGNNSILSSYKFWLSILGVILGVIFVTTQMEPLGVSTENINEVKLRESREFFYQTCMGSGTYYQTGSEEYQKMEESCRKGMSSINDPEYKNNFR